MSTDLKIVVVDDEQSILDIFKQYLEITGPYTVFPFDNGHQALDIITGEKIDCCFLDLSMPGMNGIELAEKIHRYDNTIPIIVMTGYPTMDNAIKTIKNGVVDFLIKPVEMRQISLTINRILREKSLLTDNILLKEEARKSEQLLKINQELQEKIRDMEIMNLILQELDKVSDSKELFEIIVKISGRVADCDEAHFCIHTPDTPGYKAITSYHRKPEQRATAAGFVEKRLFKKIADDRMPVIVRGTNSNGNIMAIPLKIRGNVFGILFLTIRELTRNFTEKDLYFMNFLVEKASYLIENLALYENIYENLFSTLYAFVEAIEARDPYTRQHSTRVATIAMSIAKAIDCPQEQIEKLQIVGYLHDIGKIGIPDNILLKPGRLTDEEYAIIKNHPMIGSNIISHLGMWVDEQKIIRHHHERYDGTGYPDALKGDEIPFLSRILSVADVYDALTSDRSYRRKMPNEVALNIIKENSGTQFDSDIVDVFLQIYSRETGLNYVEAAVSAG